MSIDEIKNRAIARREAVNNFWDSKNVAYDDIDALLADNAKLRAALAVFLDNTSDESVRRECERLIAVPTPTGDDPCPICGGITVCSSHAHVAPTGDGQT